MTRFGKYAVAAIAVFTLCGTANAMTPGRHPGYLHALSELRDARWLLNHRPGDVDVKVGEEEAIHDINAAIGDCNHAASLDDKNLDAHPPVDFPPTQPGRLHKALDLLGQALAEVDRPEDNSIARPYQRGAIRHIQAAIDETREALAGLHYGQ